MVTLFLNLPISLALFLFLKQTGVEIDATSPAVGYGVDTSTLIKGDFRGACYNNPPTCGAYEVNPVGKRR